MSSTYSLKETKITIDNGTVTFCESRYSPDKRESVVEYNGRQIECLDPKITRVSYPECTQFPMDIVCKKIVQALEKRDWQVPGIKVTLVLLEKNKERVVAVRSIDGTDFKIWIDRKQGLEEGFFGYNNTYGGPSIIVIPKKHLSVKSDESGPTLRIYADTKWETDKHKFKEETLFRSKKYGNFRNLLYSGNCGKPEYQFVQYDDEVVSEDIGKYKYSSSWYRGRRAPFLSYITEDSSWLTWSPIPTPNEYPPQKNEQLYFNTDEVYKEFTKFLEDGILEKIST